MVNPTEGFLQVTQKKIILRKSRNFNKIKSWIEDELYLIMKCLSELIKSEGADISIYRISIKEVENLPKKIISLLCATSTKCNCPTKCPNILTSLNPTVEGRGKKEEQRKEKKSAIWKKAFSITNLFTW